MIPRLPFAVAILAIAVSLQAQTAPSGETRFQRFTRQSRVNVDSEMASLIQLQNAYAANARVMSTAQTMWETFFGSVR